LDIEIPAGDGKIANLFLQCIIFDVQYEEYVKGRMSDTTTGFGIELGKNREDFNHTHLMPSRNNGVAIYITVDPRTPAP
jgi:hypothetical protein